MMQCLKINGFLCHVHKWLVELVNSSALTNLVDTQVRPYVYAIKMNVLASFVYILFLFLLQIQAHLTSPLFRIWTLPECLKVTGYIRQYPRIGSPIVGKT